MSNKLADVKPNPENLIEHYDRADNCNEVNSVEPPHDKTNTMACAPSEDSDQPGHLPSLIRVFAVRSMGN